MEQKLIMLLIVDIDGTLTDGRYTVSSNGIISKSWHTRDYHGIDVLSSMGVDVLLLTAAKDSVLKHKMDSLPKRVKDREKIAYIIGVEDKKSKVEEVFAAVSVICGVEMSWENVAYIGDDVNDLECMRLAGWTGCPADAVDAIKDQSNFICNSNGGYGAVREFIDDMIHLDAISFPGKEEK